MKARKRIELILASRSRARASILKKAGYRFRVVESGYRESLRSNKSPQDLVQYLALQKARKVADRYPKATIIGADTVVVLQKKVIGKPRSRKDARRILRILSNKEHVVLTAVAVVYAKGELSEVAKSVVRIRELSKDDIERYIESGEGMGAAGAYAVQGTAKKFVQLVRGRMDTIIGLPMGPLLCLLQKLKK